MEKYLAKRKNQNFMSKLSLIPSFCFLKFEFMSVEEAIIFSVK